MQKIFRKSKMLTRAAAEDKLHRIGPVELAIMEEMDGTEAKPDLWRQAMYEDMNAYYCKLANGREISVSIHDCDNISD